MKVRQFLVVMSGGIWPSLRRLEYNNKRQNKVTFKPRFVCFVTYFVIISYLMTTSYYQKARSRENAKKCLMYSRIRAHRFLLKIILNAATEMDVIALPHTRLVSATLWLYMLGNAQKKDSFCQTGDLLLIAVSDRFFRNMYTAFINSRGSTGLESASKYDTCVELNFDCAGVSSSLVAVRHQCMDWFQCTRRLKPFREIMWGMSCEIWRSYLQSRRIVLVGLVLVISII